MHSEVVGSIKAAIIVFSSESHPKMLISLTSGHFVENVDLSYLQSPVEEQSDPLFPLSHCV